jgi:hypothetical protein
MLVTVCGPNLRNQDNGQFDIHKAGCRDIGRNGGESPWTITVACKKEVVESIFSDIISENVADGWTEDDSYNMCRSDVHFFPCVNGLQERG